MSESGNGRPDKQLAANVRNLDAVRQRRKNVVGKNAMRYHRNSDRPRETSAKVIRLFPEEEPEFSEEDLIELEGALNTIDSISGHRYNAIKNWLMELGESYGDYAERVATVRVADFIKSNPRANLSAVRAVIFGPPS